MRWARRFVRLLFELLEDRRVPAGNIISGYVYNDLNGNGLRDAGELAIVNNPIELRNAAGAVVGTTTTDDNGYYQFDSDQSVNTTLQTQVRTLNFDNGKANTIRTQSLQQFDPSLGTLQSIEIRVDGRIISDIKLENLDDEATPVTGAVSGTVLVSGPGFNLNLNIQGNATIAQTLGAYDGSTDYTGTSGVTLGSRTASGTSTQTLTGSALNSFVGNGTVNLSFLAQATTQASGGGNLMANIGNQGGGQVTVTYRFLNATNLKAGQYKIVQKTQPAGLLDGRDSQNGVIVANSFNNDSLNVTLSQADVTDNNFGEYQPAKLSGYVYHDSNDNGFREVTEKVFANSQIKLTGTDDRGAAISLTGKTDAQGLYQFANLRPGNYTVSQTSQPAGYTAGKITVGSEGGSKGSARIINNVGLNVGVAATDYNFAQLGAKPPSSTTPGLGKGNLVGSQPKPPLPVVIPAPVSIGKGGLVGGMTSTPATTPTPAAPSSGTIKPPSSTPTATPAAASAGGLGKGKLVGTQPKPPASVNPPAAVTIGKGGLVGGMTSTPATTPTPAAPSSGTIKPPSSTPTATPAAASAGGLGKGKLVGTQPKPPASVNPPAPVSIGKGGLIGGVATTPTVAVVSPAVKKPFWRL